MRSYAVADPTQGSEYRDGLRDVKPYAAAPTTNARAAAPEQPEMQALAEAGSVKGYANGIGTAATDPERFAAQPSTKALGAVKSFVSHGHGSDATPVSNIEAWRQVGYPHILVSYAYDEDCTFFESRLGYNPRDWLGDSGAFTAWTLGKSIDRDKLIAWCKWHVERNPEFTCISLDVIPGEAGGNQEPSTREKNRALAASMDNGDAMRAAGLKIMEVFHVFESMKQLDRLLERRQPGEILGLGGMVGRSTLLRRQFCDGVFARLREHAGGWNRIVPVHGLGLAVSSPLASRYPWWSVDSSSWLTPARFGRGVGRSGKSTGDDRRSSNRDVRQLYLTRVLEDWLRREATLTQMWYDRGVRFDFGKEEQ